MMASTIRDLPIELANRAKEELNEVPGRIQEDLSVLREWIAKQNHLKARTDDQFLVAFLRGCKYSLERTKEKIDMYYTIRGAIPEFFSNRDPMDKVNSKVIDSGLCLPMPKVDEVNHSRIFLVKQGDYNPSEISIMDVTKVSYMISDILLWDDDYTVVAGQTILVDLKGLSFSHLKQVSPTLIK